MMKKPLFSLLLIMSLYSSALAQFESRLYTRPKLPPRSVLERLNLKLAWAGRVVAIGRRDGIASFQIAPRRDKDTGEILIGSQEVLIQTRRGLVELLDAETGDVKWIRPVGMPFEPLFAAGYNNEAILVTRRDTLYSLNRNTGKHRLFDVDEKTGVLSFGYGLGRMPAAALAADKAGVIIPSGTQVTAYAPEATYYPEVIAQLKQLAPGSDLAKIDFSVQGLYEPAFIWNINLVGVSTTQPPLLSEAVVEGPKGKKVVKGYLAIVGNEGTFVVLNKYDSSLISNYRMKGTVSVAMGQYGQMAYVGCDDHTLYAFHIPTGELRWRYMTGAPVKRQPQATYKDVFVTSLRKGMARVDRRTGRRVWFNSDADRFLAVNQRFVYATGFRGSLLVLDYVRGRTLARYDMRDYVVPISNTLTDRIYLAAHDGTVICLHLRDNRTPFYPSASPADGK